MEHLLNRSALLRQAMFSVVDYPLAEASPRLQASLDAALLSVEHGESLRVLMEVQLGPSAAAMLRCQFEAFVRAVWLLSRASEDQVELLSSPPTAEGRENVVLPMLSPMLRALGEDPQLANMVPHLMELKQYAWPALNSFIHAGVHALGRSREGFPLELAVNVVRCSNNLMMMAGQHMAILSGQPGLQREVLNLNDSYTDCLLLDEDKRVAIEAAAGASAHAC